MSTQADADRNALFGTLAVQMGFVSRDDLATATAEWAGDKSRSLGDVLCERKAPSVEHTQEPIDRELRASQRGPGSM